MKPDIKSTHKEKRIPFPSPRALAIEILGRFRDNEFNWSNNLDVLESRDRALVRQLVSGTLRMRGKLDYYLSHFLHGKLQDLPREVRDILRITVFQLKHCDRIPDYAAVNEAVELTGKVAGGKYRKLVNGVLRSLLRDWDAVVLPDAEQHPVEYLSVEYSHPPWLVKRYLDRFGCQTTEALLKANNTLAPLTIRSEKFFQPDGEVKRNGFAEKLGQAGISVKRGFYLGEALVLEQCPCQPSELPGYSEGSFYVQDEAAMLAGYLASPSPGDLIFDLCAAPGGKTTHLARLAGEQSAIFACDPSQNRLNKLGQNLRRLNLNNVKILVADASQPPLRKAGLVLLDVPCSGTGVIRRKPEIRWRISLGEIKKLAGLQSKLIRAASGCVDSGGILIYSTCSIEPEENRGIVESFLKDNPDMRLDPAGNYLPGEVVSDDGYLETFPHLHGIDGAFAARLVLKK